MQSPEFGRRTFLSGTVAAAALASAAPKQAQAADGFETDTFKYEINRTEAEWRSRLDDIEYYILREFGTEAPRSSTLWNNTVAGTYSCKGCDLRIYESRQKIELERGWTFFRHSDPDAVMTGLDLNGGTMGDPFAEVGALMEVHCRRCGSHLGHLVALPEVRGRPIHCINGFSLKFTAANA